MRDGHALRPMALGVATASAVALAFAFALQHVFGVAPCNLCIWERWPYVVAVVAALGGVMLGRPRAGLALAGLALLGNAGLAAYHVGVEQGWLALPEGCAAAGQASSLGDLRAQLQTAPARCDQVAAAWLGVSLAAWNGLYALGLAALALISAASAPRSRSARRS